jgi:hypothetical protein
MVVLFVVLDRVYEAQRNFPPALLCFSGYGF